MKEQENISLLTDASFSVSISLSGSVFERGHYTVSNDENYENNTQDKDDDGLSVVNTEIDEENIVTSSRVRKPLTRLLVRLKKVTIATSILSPKTYLDIVKVSDKCEWYQAYNKEV
eukprot:snap_masked-scaffold_12-processed-gene-10.52-mRNA-1 protein AED:1.00 eAED:1.00 QI:0/0/0/0/1/1/2/0/115